MLGTQEDAIEIDGKHPSTVRQSHLADRSAERDSSGVHEHVQLSGDLNDVSESSFPLPLNRDVE
jgi:hypothetical protein